MAALAGGQFKSSTDGNSALFIGNVSGKEFNRVFLAQLRPNGNQRPSVVVADSGHMTERPDARGYPKQRTRYEGTALLRDFRITDFINYQAIIGHQEVQQNNNVAERTRR